jgi:RNA-directed DNA polymerase
MNRATQVMYEWQDLPWHTLEKQVFKLQTRIFQATKRGEVKAVRRLQRLLMTSRAACYLAVRRVTQDNRGKKTAGVDGVKSLRPAQRRLLAEKLKHAPFACHARPVRRVWIPKPGKQEQRPLGIPVMEDRARQALAKMALEPEWEATFEPHSCGFRPGRSAHDAIRVLYESIANLPLYVLDADIAHCFDRIYHEALCGKVNSFPRLRRVIKQWLTAGIMNGDEVFPSTEGVPQGGCRTLPTMLPKMSSSSRRATTISLLPDNRGTTGPLLLERCTQKSVTIAGAQVRLRDARRELYHPFCNFVGSVKGPPCGVPSAATR